MKDVNFGHVCSERLFTIAVLSERDTVLLLDAPTYILKDGISELSEK